MAWNRTYNLPTITLNSSNNYGPRQHFEKLIPLTIKNALLKNLYQYMEMVYKKGIGFM